MGGRRLLPSSRPSRHSGHQASQLCIARGLGGYMLMRKLLLLLVLQAGQPSPDGLLCRQYLQGWNHYRSGYRGIRDPLSALAVASCRLDANRGR